MSERFPAGDDDQEKKIETASLSGGGKAEFGRQSYPNSARTTEATIKDAAGRRVFDFQSTVGPEDQEAIHQTNDYWDSGAQRLHTAHHQTARGDSFRLTADRPDGMPERSVEIEVDHKNGEIVVKVSQYGPDGEPLGDKIDAVRVPITPVEVYPPEGIDFSQLLPGDKVPWKKGPRQAA